MNFDAVVVAGGRGSRLGGEPKPLLVHRGKTLLEHSLEALADAARIAVVGPPELSAAVSRFAAAADPGQLILLTREHPAFAGPAAAVAAGLHALAEDTGAANASGESDDLEPEARSESPLTVVLAADLLDPGPAVAGVVAAAGRDFDAGSAWVPVDATGRLQPLSCAVATDALRAAVGAAEAGTGGLADSSMMLLLAKVHIVRLALDGVEFNDVDTWADAGRHGIGRPERNERPEDGTASGGTRGGTAGTGTVG